MVFSGRSAQTDDRDSDGGGTVIREALTAYLATLRGPSGRGRVHPAVVVGARCVGA
jgi:hypothetical protein